MPVKREVSIEWVLSNTREDPDTGCLVWTLALSPKGYARFNPVRGKTVQAHRYVYEQLVGPIPDGYDIDHLCRNRGCINFKHLEPVPPIVNQQRGLLGVLFTAPKVCRKHGHDLTLTGAYVKGKGCVECRKLAVKRGNDKGNAHRSAEKRAADPTFGRPENRALGIRLTAIRKAENGELVGVRHHGKFWEARVHEDGKHVCLGKFDTPDEAREAYLKWARQTYQELLDKACEVVA